MARTVIQLAIVICLSLSSWCSSFALAPITSPSRSSTFLQMTLLNYKGKKVEIKEGTPLSQACVKLGLKPTYSCKKGDCATCTVTVGSYCLKACVDKVPPMPKLKSLQENGLIVK